MLPAIAADVVPLFRLYSPGGTDHFYTASANERTIAATNDGYNTEGIAAYVYPAPICGTVPFYRMYQPSIVDHFYTTNEAERENAVNNLGYQDEGIVGYINPQSSENCNCGSS